MSVKSFLDLDVWHLSMELAEDIYPLVRRFPLEERFALSLQLRKAGVSIPSNIAEGSGYGTNRRYVHHLRVACGSDSEVPTQLMLAERLKLAKASEVKPILEKASRVGANVEWLDPVTRPASRIERTVNSKLPIPDPRSPIPDPRSPIPYLRSLIVFPVMLARHLRYAAAGIAVLGVVASGRAQVPAGPEVYRAAVAASVTTLLAQPGPTATEIYRAAVAEHLKTGDAAHSSRPLATLTPADLEPAVKAILARADPRELEGAADLQLEIGIAVAGLSVSGAADYFEQGSRLVTAILPPPAIRKGLSAERLEEMTLTSATWHRVAASTFLSINDVARARPLIRRAQRFVPQSAAILTILGTAHEIDAGVNNPDVFDSVSGRTRMTYMRSSTLLLAEESYKAAIESDPNYALALIRLGRVQFLQGNVKAARASLERGAILAREPRHQFLAAMFMGALQQSQNDLESARQSYARASSLMPQSQHAVAALAFVDLMSGRIDRAERIARAYTSAKLDDAWWLHKTGVFDVEGLQWLRQHLRQ